MPTYVFKGRNRLNEVVVGERVADNREALRQILRREQGSDLRQREGPRDWHSENWRTQEGQVQRPVDLYDSFVMIDAGLPLVQCLKFSRNSKKHFQQTLMQVRDVERRFDTRCGDGPASKGVR